MDGEKVIGILQAVAERIQREKDYLTQLDNEIADGDHGINMARGFAAVSEKLPALAGSDIGAILKTVGMTLVSVVAGSAGPLYGTIFLKSGMFMAGKREMDITDFLTCLELSIEGVKQRGRSTAGEKTMLDAMIPALSAMRKAEGASGKEILAAGVSAAWAGVEYTKTIPATKGRASYIGERSIGHQDPGATSFSDILETIAERV